MKIFGPVAVSASTTCSEKASLLATQTRMRMLVVNTSVGLAAGWLALLDHCLIAAAQIPMPGAIVVLLILQAIVLALVSMLVNGALPALREMATGDASTRMKIIVFVVPLIFFVISPAMISESMYEVRYGTDKFVVNAHVGHDLACCLNPLHSWKQ